LFLVEALNRLGASYVFYFSFALGLLISLPIAAARTYQALYQGRLRRPVSILAEILVESLRIVQYALFIVHGAHAPFRSLFAGDFWKEAFAGIHQLETVPLLWDVLGYAIVFGLYNAVLLAILRPANVRKMMDRTGIRGFEVSAVRNAVLLAFKNLFLIPVSVIYLLDMLNIM
jgi:hypothetical protein